MPKKPISWEHLAAQAWPILANAAKENRTISYKQLGTAIGLHHRSVRYVLGIIQDYCLAEHLPPLTGLVVRQQERVPGSGFIAWDVDDLEAGLGRVYSADWSAMPNPFRGFGSQETVKSFATQIVETPDSAADVYQKVRDRGIAQRIFREGLLQAYDHRCAMCDLSFPDVLQAAHIVAFAECSPDQRIKINNGILLCANHHLLFDTGALSLSRDFVLTYYDPRMGDGPYSPADQAATVGLHGKKIRIPKDPRLWPRFENDER